jgi:hypothetical protein
MQRSVRLLKLSIKKISNYELHETLRLHLKQLYSKASN